MALSEENLAAIRTFRASCTVHLDLFHRCSCKWERSEGLPGQVCIAACPLTAHAPLPSMPTAIPGRIRDYYRHGSIRTCAPYWSDFLFCARLKYYEDDEANVSTVTPPRPATVRWHASRAPRRGLAKPTTAHLLPVHRSSI